MIVPILIFWDFDGFSRNEIPILRFEHFQTVKFKTGIFADFLPKKLIVEQILLDFQIFLRVILVEGAT